VSDPRTSPLRQDAARLLAFAGKKEKEREKGWTARFWLGYMRTTAPTRRRNVADLGKGGERRKGGRLDGPSTSAISSMTTLTWRVTATGRPVSSEREREGKDPLLILRICLVFIAKIRKGKEKKGRGEEKKGGGKRERELEDKRQFSILFLLRQLRPGRHAVVKEKKKRRRRKGSHPFRPAKRNVPCSLSILSWNRPTDDEDFEEEGGGGGKGRGGGEKGVCLSLLYYLF